MFHVSWLRPCIAPATLVGVRQVRATSGCRLRHEHPRSHAQWARSGLRCRREPRARQPLPLALRLVVDTRPGVWPSEHTRRATVTARSLSMQETGHDSLTDAFGAWYAGPDLSNIP